MVLLLVMAEPARNPPVATASKLLTVPHVMFTTHYGLWVQGMVRHS
jgi:hypothetical protein